MATNRRYRRPSWCRSCARIGRSVHYAVSGRRGEVALIGASAFGCCRPRIGSEQQPAEQAAGAGRDGLQRASGSHPPVEPCDWRVELVREQVSPKRQCQELSQPGADHERQHPHSAGLNPPDPQTAQSGENGLRSIDGRPGLGEDPVWTPKRGAASEYEPGDCDARSERKCQQDKGS